MIDLLCLLGPAWLGLAPTAPPCITQIMANPVQVQAGQPAQLTWTLSGGAPATLTLEDDLSGAPPVDLLGKSGLTLPQVVRRQTFTLKAANGLGSCQASLTLVARGLSLLAGSAGGPGGLDGLQGAACFQGPTALVLDGAGNLIVADTWNDTIRQVTPGGRVTTLAGQTGQVGALDGVGLAARFHDPEGLAWDPASGILYVADTGNHTIRAIGPDGQVTTLAGAPGQSGAADGQGAAARFTEPRGLAVGADGTVYVADSGNNLIRQISPGDRTVTTVAGTAGIWGNADGPRAMAQFAYPWALAVGGDQSLYVADTFNNAIRKITAGVVTTLAGASGKEGTRDGDLQTAEFSFPMGILVKNDGGLLVCDAVTGRIRAIDGGEVTTLAPESRPFKDPEGLALDASGTLYVADTGNCAIRRWTAGTGITTLAGAQAPPDRDSYQQASKVVVEPVNGAGLVSDGNGVIRRLLPRGAPQPLPIQPAFGKMAELKGLGGFTQDGAGTIFAANLETGAILRIGSDGLASILAAPPEAATSGGTPGLRRPVDVAVDSGGNLFVTDALEATVRRVSREGTVSLFAGTAMTAGHLDGPGETASFTQPSGIAVDGGDNLIVADPGAHTIRRISPIGYVTTLAGKAGEAGSADGDAATARFNQPQGVAVDGWGNVYVADTGNATVRRISPGGAVTTVAGVPGKAGGVMGPLPGGLAQPRSVAVTPEGDLLVLCGEGIVQVTAP